MTANANDMFQKVSRSTATTLSAPGYTIGATSINVASTSNWPADTGITFAIDEVDGNGNRINGTYNIFRGTVGSATQLANLTYVGGDANRNYSAGATTRVYILVSYARENRLVDGLLVSHNQDGTLKAGAVDNAAVLASNVVETSKIKDANVTPIKLSTSPSGFGMQEIARTTLSTADDTITVNSIPVRDHIKILIGYIASGGTADASFRINNLSSAIYRMTYNVSPAISTGTDTGAVTSLPVESGVVASGVKGYCVIDMWNASGGRRIGNMVTVSDTTSVLAWLRGSFIIDTSSQMTRFDLTNAGTGDFGVGSEVIVLGTN